MPVLRTGPTCTFTAIRCGRPLYQEGLCRPHHDQWKAFGGEHPGTEQPRYVVQRDGVIFDVIDTTTGRPATLGNLVAKNLDANGALDVFNELREELEESDEAA